MLVHFLLVIYVSNRLLFMYILTFGIVLNTCLFSGTCLFKKHVPLVLSLVFLFMAATFDFESRQSTSAKRGWT